MQSTVIPRYKIRGTTFGVRGCSAKCSCNPCDCNPCLCGDAINYPAWRVSGCFIHRGSIDQVDLSNTALLRLALPVEPEALADRWHEVWLVDHAVSEQQITLLLHLFADDLQALPAEVTASPQAQLPLYRISLTYGVKQSRPYITVDATPENRILYTSTSECMPSWQWSYDGPMALRTFF